MTKKQDKILECDVMFEEADEGGYTVLVPSLPGCISEGDTFEEAKKNITEAIKGYLESLVKDKEEIKMVNRNFFIGKIQIPFPRFAY